MAATTLPKAYDFNATEKRLYEWWEKNGYFEPVVDPSKKPFVISIPPPNVTGELHLGHAMFVSMEDLMIRYHRMKGIPALWLPGTDHAGIATQLMVEKSLIKEGTTRDAIGREAFVKRTWDWKKKYGGMITQQLRRLGASCDWKRERFTLDEGLSKAVREAFVRLYEKGLIYRGPRLINWSPLLRTAVSDLEVEYSQEDGFLYYFKYVLADNPEEYIPVATTRPETILGDSAVAVHPEDERYQKFIGRKVIVPMLNRQVPVIADEYVDRAFGTGALKITPAHDPNDYTIGQKHKLEFISIFDTTAHVTSVGGAYAGMERFECRKKLWEDMRAAGLVIKEQPYTLNVPRTQRGGEIVEPMISTQWFVTIKPLAEKALEAVRSGEIKIVPEYYTKVYYNWLENIEDWCISRQLWWGHRIPVWYCDDCQEITVSRSDPSECAKCHSKHIHQEEDVLDTWFSSGLWPFSTLGWPENTADLQYFYPTSVLETGYDILFFWVARMIMFGIEFTGKAPFNTVYLHGLIRDENGQKMSKTKGNVIDPLIVMDEMGTDALRFTLLVGSTPGNDANLSLKKVEANRNFANKMWNAGRFIIGALENAPGNAEGKAEYSLADRWIWSRTHQLVADVERLFQSYQYGEAGRQIYDFFWSEFADWYIEAAKLQMNQGGDRAYYTAQRLAQVLDIALRLLHPFTPFVTEEIWGFLKQVCREHPAKFLPTSGKWEDALIIAKWPEAVEKAADEKAITDFGLIQEIIRSIRNLRSEKQVKPGQKLPAKLAASAETAGLLKAESGTIAALSWVDASKLEIFSSEKGIDCPEGWIPLVAGPVQIFVDLASTVDLGAERARMEKELAEINGQIERLEKLLGSDFAQKAPAPLVEKERQKLAGFKESAERLKTQLG